MGAVPVGSPAGKPTPPVSKGLLAIWLTMLCQPSR